MSVHCLRPDSAPAARSSGLRTAALIAALVAASGWAPAARAGVGDDLFRTRYSFATAGIVRFGTNDITNMAGLFDGDEIRALEPGFTDTSELTAQLDMRGVLASAGFRQNETAFFLELILPGISIEIDGGDRRTSLELFEQWLKGDFEGPSSPQEAITELLQAFVAESPVEPMAGNPNSLQTQMLQTPYDLAMRASFRPRDPTAPDAEGRVWNGEDVVGFEADFAPFWADVWQGFGADLAFRYTLNFEDPRIALIFDLPVSYRQTEVDARTLMLQGGIGLLVRATPWWNVGPFGRVGIAGSLQLGSLGMLYSAGVSSHMQWTLADTVLRLGNSFGASSSIDGIDWFGYTLDYAITNYLVRNGFEVEHAIPGRLRGRPLFARLSFSDNWVLGSDVYVDHYNEVGLTVGSLDSLGSGATHDRATLGITYVGAPNVNGLRVELGFDF